jgi:hypothetical protein
MYSKLLTTLAVALCFPATSLAAQSLYAAPSPQGAGNCSSPANACGLTTAFADTQTGDQLILAGNGGTYGTAAAPLTQTLTPPAGVYALDVHGAAGETRPVIYSNATIVMELLGIYNGQGFTASDVDLEDLQTGSPGSGLWISGSIDHVLARSTGKGVYACNISGSPLITSVVTDTTCIGDEHLDAALFNENSSAGQQTTVIRNDTLESPRGVAGLEVSGANGADVTAQVTNTIIDGGQDDVQAIRNLSSNVTVTIDHSDYATETDFGTDATFTAPGGATNITARPLFVNGPADNFHEATGSPTIGAGITAAANGTTDLDGNPRTSAGATDIGAYQALPGTIAVLTTSAHSNHGAITLKIRCSTAPRGCAGKLQLTENITIKLGSATFSLTPGGTASVKVKLSEKALKLLKRDDPRRLSGRVQVQRIDGGTTASAPITLIR